MLVSINPTTGREIARYPLDAPDRVTQIIAAAAAVQAEWRLSPMADRAALLNRIAAELRRDKERLARLITVEMGKPLVEAEAEIEKCAMTCAFYAVQGPAWLEPEAVAIPERECAVVYDPLGVVLAIMPWNYPFWQFFRFFAPALLAGNGAILKHAANVCGAALAIAEVLQAAGCPLGLAGVVLVEPSQVAGIIADPRIAAVTLTGSTEVGAIVAAQAGRALKKQVLELGGSDPFIVLADADLEAATETAVLARYINVGQSCVNAKRFIVEAAVADRFAALFCEKVARLKTGDPMERDVRIGPMAKENLRQTLHSQVQRSISQGATLLLGGQIPDGPGAYYPPTVLDHVTPGMTAFVEETFGPVAAIIRARDADHAVALANDSPYGLGAALWTRDLVRARVLSRQIEAGAVFINGMTASDPRYPFGGIKRSGYGRELGSYGLREFTNIKTVWIGPAT
jgi:acyl-CoA reductase-like NAD-dependent aldehyde dehydrogenase